MTFLLLLLGFLYGVVFLLSLFWFLAVTVATCIQESTGILDEVHQDESPDDLVDLLLFCLPRHIGRVRVAIWSIVALLWPLSILLLAIFMTIVKGKSLDEMPVWGQKAVFWVFLGFGKFHDRDAVKVA